MQRLLALAAVLSVFLSIGAEARAETQILPSELTTIEEEAFAGDTSLDEVMLPEGMVSIGPRAFAGSSLARINLPFSLDSIAEDAFQGAEPTAAATAGTYAYRWAVEHGLSTEGTVVGELSASAAATLNANPAYASLTARRLTIDGIPLNEVYTDNGVSKPLVIFIHGGYGSKDSIFNQACNAALRGFYCVCIDCAACGDSDLGPIDDVDFLYMTVSQIDALIGHYAAVSQADETHFGLWGNSMGSLVVFAYAVHGSYRPTIIIPMRATPDFTALIGRNPGPLYGCFDHGERREGESVLPLEDIENMIRAYSPMNQPEKFLDMYIYAGNSTADQVFDPDGCMALKQYLDASGGTKHEFHFYEGLTHEQAFPDFDPVGALCQVLLPALAQAYQFNMFLPPENANGFDVSVTNRTRGISLKNREQMEAVYGDDFSWSFETENGEQFDSLSWGEDHGAFTFELENLYEIPTGSELTLKAVLNWGTITAETIFHFHIDTVPLPAEVHFDQSARMTAGEPYRATVSIEPEDWDVPHFLYYTIDDSMCNPGSVQYWHSIREEPEAFYMGSTEAGVFLAQPRLVIGDNAAILGEWFTAAVLNTQWQVSEGELSAAVQNKAASNPAYSALTTRRLTVEGIPLYEVYCDNGLEKPLVIILHGGGGGSKEQSMTAGFSAFDIALQGLYAVAIDCAGCGESQLGPIDAVTCWSITLSQIDTIVEYYDTISQADAEHFGLFGSSMGGNIAFSYVAHGLHWPVMIVPSRATPEPQDLAFGPAFDAFDRGRKCEPVLPQEEIIKRFSDMRAMNRPEKFEDLYIYSASGLADTVTGPNGCRALESYLNEAGGTKHLFNFYEGCGHGDPYPADYDPIGALRQILLHSDAGPFTQAQS